MLLRPTSFGLCLRQVTRWSGVSLLIFAGACSLRDLSHLDGGSDASTGGAPSGGSEGSGGMGGASSGGTSMGLGGAQAYAHSIECDGDLSDWKVGEHDFETTTPDWAIWVSWDEDNIYLMAQGADYENEMSNIRFRAYFGDGSSQGANIGPTIGTTTPDLPFAAQFFVSIDADGSQANLWEFDTTWGTAAALTSGQFAYSAANGLVEFCLPRADILGSGGELLLAAHHSNTNDSGVFFAGFPSDAFAGSPKGATVQFQTYGRFALDQTGTPPNAPRKYPIVDR